MTDNRMRLAVIDFLEKRIRELEIQIKKETSKEVARFTLNTYLESKSLLRRMRSEQETKAVQAAEDLWHQGF